MLISKNTKKLLLHTARYKQVVDAIPHAKVLEHGGALLTAVPHKIDEVQVLKNMGYRNVPSPILHYYGWPSRSLKPMEHQRATAAFLTMNRRALCLSAPGCVDADTEYLSPTGWARIADYAGGKVAQFDPNTDEVSFVDAEYVKLPCTDMIRVKTKYGIDQLLSPEHRCLIYDKRNTTRREVITAEELLRRQGTAPARRVAIAMSGAGVKTTFIYGGAGLQLTDAELRVQVAAIADGHFHSKDSNNRRCYVRVKKERKKLRLRALLDAASIEYIERQKDYPTATGFSVFSFIAPMRTKVFDASWYSASKRQLEVIYEEVQHWDSAISPNPNRGWRFSSYEKQSADFVQFVCAATGRTARVIPAVRERRGKVETEYTVQVRPDKQVIGLHGGSSEEVVSEAVALDGFKYCFRVPSSFLVLRRNGCIFTTGNSGKTISTLWAVDFLMEVGAVSKVVVVAPLSTLKPVWANELKQNFLHRRFAVLTGSKQKRLSILEDRNVEFAIINHDGFTMMADAFKDFDLVIYDEATALKSPTSQRYKVFFNFMKTHSPWLWMLTGTPIAQSPTDAWTLAKLVGSQTVPQSFTRFKEITMQKIGMFKWIPRPEATRICKQVLQPSIRYSLDECKDLPDTVFLDHECELTPAQAKAFKEMQDNAVIASANISAPNAAIVLGKLIQIACGGVYDMDGEVVEFDASSRYDTLLEVVEEIGDKLIIFVPLRGVQDLLVDRLRKSGYETASVHGGVGKAERDDIFHKFQNTEQIKILVAHPKTAAHGLTLTRAKDIVWYAPIYSLEQYEQANARIRRLSTQGKTRVHHISATKFERELYRRLKDKKRVLTDFLSIVSGINE